MTAMAERLSDSHWQTLAGRVFLVVLTVLLGRWAAGVTFGYVLFAAIWGPIAAMMLIDGRNHCTAGNRRRSIGPFLLISVGMAFLMALPIFVGWPIRTAIFLSGVLVVLHACTVGIALFATLVFGRTLGQTVTAILWLTWLVVPMTAAETVSHSFSEAILSQLLAVHPILVLNQLDPVAGDWTHQAVAYRWLTRLGQDLPFEWPGQVWPFLLVHGVLAAIGFNGIGLRMFHVEHSVVPD